MGKRALNQAMYDELVAVYRNNPDAHENASRQVGCDVRTAHREWHHGWPQKGWPSIKKYLQDEQLEARKRTAALEAEAAKVQNRLTQMKPTLDREQLRADQIKRREDWSKASLVARGNAVALMGVQSELLRGALEKAKDWKAQLIHSDLPLPDAVKLMRDITSCVKQANDALEVAQRVEHLALGDPTEIFGLRAVTETGTLEDAARNIDIATRAVARARQKGLILPAPIDVEVEPVPQLEAADASGARKFDA